MKKLLMIAGVWLLLTGLAIGQQWMPRARVSVPFEFVVGEMVLPAGTYSILARSGSNPTQLMFRSAETGKAAVANNIDIGMKSLGNVENSNLVFVRDANGQHVLHEVWIMGDSHGHDLNHKAGVPEPQVAK